MKISAEQIKIKVILNCEKEVIMSLKEFIDKFNKEEINSFTDVVELVQGDEQ